MHVVREPADNSLLALEDAKSRNWESGPARPSGSHGVPRLGRTPYSENGRAFGIRGAADGSPKTSRAAGSFGITAEGASQKRDERFSIRFRQRTQAPGDLTFCQDRELMDPDGGAHIEARCPPLLDWEIELRIPWL